MSDWVRDEVARRWKAHFDALYSRAGFNHWWDDIHEDVKWEIRQEWHAHFECCLRAGLLEAARQLEARAAHTRSLWPDGDHEEIVKTWDIAAADLRALAGEEPSYE